MKHANSWKHINKYKLHFVSFSREIIESYLETQLLPYRLILLSCLPGIYCWVYQDMKIGKLYGLCMIPFILFRKITYTRHDWIMIICKFNNLYQGSRNVQICMPHHSRIQTWEVIVKLTNWVFSIGYYIKNDKHKIAWHVIHYISIQTICRNSHFPHEMIYLRHKYFSSHYV